MACQSINDPTLVTAGADGALGVWTRDGTLVGRHKFQISDGFGGLCGLNYIDHICTMQFKFCSWDLDRCIFLLSGKPKSQNNVLVDLVSLGNLQLCREPITSVIFHPEKTSWLQYQSLTLLLLTHFLRRVAFRCVCLQRHLF